MMMDLCQPNVEMLGYTVYQVSFGCVGVEVMGWGCVGMSCAHCRDVCGCNMSLLKQTIEKSI